MEENLLISFKDQLEDRKEQLTRSLEKFPEHQEITKLLGEVDAALEKIQSDTYGICEICHDPIETERLLVDPLMNVCIDHLNRQQRRALESDLEYAGKIQRALFPEKEIKTNHWEFAYHYLPAGTVGGDFCNVIQLKDDSMFFILGDVSGKGVSASIMMSNLHALIQSLLSFNLPINEILQKTNRLFCESTLSPNYATMVLGKAYPDGTVEICIAGHNPPLAMQGGRIISIGATGIPVGMFCNSEYSTKKLKLNKNDSILLYTDGLSEASVNGNEFGEERIKTFLSNLDGLGSKEIIENLVIRQRDFLKNAKHEDDILVAAIKKT